MLSALFLLALLLSGSFLLDQWKSSLLREMEKKIHLLNLIIFPLPFAFCHTHTHTLALPHLFTRALVLIKERLPLLLSSLWVLCLCTA